MIALRKTMFFICILFLLSGCGMKNVTVIKTTPSPGLLRQIDDGGLLSKAPCGPPCFYNVIPNLTNKEQAEEILKTFYDLQDCEYWDGVDSGRLEITCPNTNKYQASQFIAIRFDRSNLVENISFTPYKLVTVKDVVDKYGSPSGVYIAGDTDDGSAPVYVFMTIQYDEMKMELRLPSVQADSYEVLPTTSIEIVSYHEINPNMFVIPWKGFQSYPVTVP